MENVVCIKKLPEEILVSIFSYLSIDDLKSSVQNVCQQWEKVSKDFEIWKYKPYVVQNQPEISISQFIRSTPYLQIFILSRPVPERLFLELYINCKFLSVLEINCNQSLTDITFKEIVTACCNISVLLLPSRYLKNYNIIKSIANMRNLETIKTKQFCSPRYVISLKPLADGCEKLENLELHGIGFETDDMKYFLGQKKHLSSISIQNQVHILDLLKINVKTLQKLEVDLNKCNIENNTTKLNALKFLVNLQILILRRLPNDVCYILPEIFENKSLRKLQQLIFADCGNIISNVGIQTICSNCSILQVLTIETENETKLTDDSINLLFSLTFLQKLTVSKNFGITKYSGRRILQCKHLQHLWLKESNVTEFLEVLFNEPGKMSIKTLVLEYCTIENVCCVNVNLRLEDFKIFTIKYCHGFNEKLLNSLQIWFPFTRFSIIETY